MFPRHCTILSQKVCRTLASRWRRNSLNPYPSVLGTWPSLNMLVSCWTDFRRFAFTNRFRERLSRVFRILFKPLFLLNNCTSPYFFHRAIVLCTVSPKSYGHHLRHFSCGFPIPEQTYSLSCVKDRSSFVGFFPAWLFMLVVAESSCSTDYQWDWTQLLLPYSFSSKLLWGKV